MRSEPCGAALGQRGELLRPVAWVPAGVEGLLQTQGKSLRGDALGRWGGLAALLPP